jgi:hypothetical protein
MQTSRCAWDRSTQHTLMHTATPAWPCTNTTLSTLIHKQKAKLKVGKKKAVADNFTDTSFKSKGRDSGHTQKTPRQHENLTRPVYPPVISASNLTTKPVDQS